MRTRGWVLGIDTSTVVSVGLSHDGEIIESLNVGDSRSHVEKLMPAIVELLDRAGITMADLSGVAVGMGPGPFTGLRVGIVTARTIAAMTKAHLFTVCSLDILARQWAVSCGVSSVPIEVSPQIGMPEEFVVCTDARRKEVYWASYRANGDRISGPVVSDPAQVPALPVFGPGTAVYPDVFGPRLVESAPDLLDAGILAAYASDIVEGPAEPLYLRQPDTSTPSARKSALPRIHLPRVAGWRNPRAEAGQESQTRPEEDTGKESQ